jgi:hypothetical protein
MTIQTRKSLLKIHLLTEIIEEEVEEMVKVILGQRDKMMAIDNKNYQKERSKARKKSELGNLIRQSTR